MITNFMMKIFWCNDSFKLATCSECIKMKKAKKIKLQMYKNLKCLLKMKLCLAFGFYNVDVRSVSGKSRAGKMLAVLASHIHIFVYSGNNRRCCRKTETHQTMAIFPMWGKSYFWNLLHIKSYSKRYGLHFKYSSDTEKSTYTAYWILKYSTTNGNWNILQMIPGGWNVPKII